MSASAGIGRWIAILAGFVVAISLARRIAIAFGAVAHPNPIVRSHRMPVPYLGGTALILGWFAVVAWSWVAAGLTPSREAIVRAACGLALMAFGTWDDLRAFGPRVKFGFQLLVCTIDIVAVGASSPWVAALHVLILVTIVNAFNLIDVMDGLLCAVAAIATAGLLWTPGLIVGSVRFELEVLLAGIAVLFLFNRPPARIYSGDAGSMTLGFLVCTWILQPARASTPLHALALVGLCAAPALELLLLVPARLQRGLSPFRGSPDHFALRLQDQLGWSKVRVLATTAAAGSVFALAPLIADRSPIAVAAGLAVMEIACGAALWFALWRIPPRTGGAAPPPAQPQAWAARK